MTNHNKLAITKIYLYIINSHIHANYNYLGHNAELINRDNNINNIYGYHNFIWDTIQNTEKNIIDSIGNMVNNLPKNTNIKFYIVSNYRKYLNYSQYFNDSETIVKNIFGNNTNCEFNNISVILKIYSYSSIGVVDGIRDDVLKTSHFTISYKLHNFMKNARNDYTNMLKILNDNNIGYMSGFSSSYPQLKILSLKNNKLYFEYYPERSIYCSDRGCFNNHINYVLDLTNEKHLKILKIKIIFNMCLQAFDEVKYMCINIDKQTVKDILSKQVYPDIFIYNNALITIVVQNLLMNKYKSKININCDVIDIIDTYNIERLHINQKNDKFHKSNINKKLSVYFTSSIKNYRNKNEEIFKGNKYLLKYYNNVLNIIKSIKYKAQLLNVIYILLINGISFELIHIYMKYIYD